MSQMYPMEPYEQSSDAVVDYRQQSRTFLARSRDYLAEGDLHQAAEKGWGAAAWMAKAVAEAQGWQYKRHEEFFTVMYQAEALAGDARVNESSVGCKRTSRVLLHPQNVPTRRCHWPGA